MTDLGELKVVDHHYDGENVVHTWDEKRKEHVEVPSPIYRLTVGTVVERHVPQTDEDGNVLMREVEATDDDGNVIHERVVVSVDEDSGEVQWEDGDPLVIHEPVVDVVSELVPLEDFVFAADDERWSGKTPKQVAALQRRIVKGALEKRLREQEEEAAKRAARVDLPGAGESL